MQNSSASSRAERGSTLVEYVVLAVFFTVTVFVSIGDAGEMARVVFGRVFQDIDCSDGGGPEIYGFAVGNGNGNGNNISSDMNSASPRCQYK